MVMCKHNSHHLLQSSVSAPCAADASIIGRLSRHHYPPSRGKIEIYGQLESTSWFNSPIFSGMFNNQERVAFYVPAVGKDF